VRCTEVPPSHVRPARVPGLTALFPRYALAALLLLLSACTVLGPAPEPTPVAVPAPPVLPVLPVPMAPAVPREGPLPPPLAARNWDEFQLQAARRLVTANPGRTYMGEVPDPLLAIPVLEVELTAEGQVRRIKVIRVPTQATDTVQLAIDAVHRAAPYGPMNQLGKPWRFVEVFLFDDDRRFKPRTLDD
jgi:hypothetical protein